MNHHHHHHSSQNEQEITFYIVLVSGTIHRQRLTFFKQVYFSQCYDIAIWAPTLAVFLESVLTGQNVNVQRPEAGFLKHAGKVAGWRAAMLVQLIIFIKSNN